MLATLPSGYATMRIYKRKYFFLLIHVNIKHNQTTENI